MNYQSIYLIIAILISAIISVVYLHLTTINSIREEYNTTITELYITINSLQDKLAQEKSQNILASEIIKNLSNRYSELSNEKEKLEMEYQELLQKYNNLSLQMNSTLKMMDEIITNHSKQEEWLIFKNLTQWFRENSEYPDPYLRSKILRECSDGFNLKIPCAVYITRMEYGYNNRISEFHTLKKFIEQGYGDCKQHALMLRELLRSLNPNMYLEGTRPVSILDTPYYNYIVYRDVILRGYTPQLFAKVSEYDFVVVCFNTEKSGHCGVAISSIPVQSYQNLTWGYVIDPLTGITLGDLGGKYIVCNSPTCAKEPNRILMVIHQKWIEYFDGQIWRRLE
ncbi:MAG: hypothetical protein QXV16_02550 [Candidatus Anstonellales archaeon]